jgi:hypothetical protein
MKVLAQASGPQTRQESRRLAENMVSCVPKAEAGSSWLILHIPLRCLTVGCTHDPSPFQQIYVVEYAFQKIYFHQANQSIAIPLIIAYTTPLFVKMNLHNYNRKKIRGPPIVDPSFLNH